MKKLASLLLVLALCMGLAVPALADEEEAPMPFEEGIAPVEIEVEEEDFAFIEREDTLYTYYATAGALNKETSDGIIAVRKGTEITVSHAGSDASTFVWVSFEGFESRAESFALDYWSEDEDDAEYISDFQGKYLFIEYWNTYYLSNSGEPTDDNSGEYKSIADGTGHYWNTGEFYFRVNDDNEVTFIQDVDAVLLYPGDSVTFKLPDDGTDTLYRLCSSIYYPQYDYTYWRWDTFKIDDELVASAPAESDQPAEPDTPSTPGTPVPEAVVLSPQNLEVDGETVECEKYNIDGSNYFKLRDLAQLLSGTGSQFGVGYDEESATVTITTGEAYESTGTELATGVDNSDTAQPSAQSIQIDGEAHGELTVYNIGGSNFFQLRELGELLGFEVGYDIDTNTAIVRSAQN